ncbi:MAG: hypothetical protein AVDCRST_MAG85-3428 [uncultured Solirubrobacteraceae bacterium]|uniref:Uncharacterized protein n=1 Tax=uncultured Solirubrobacteraceae bacterium TaxID=1162706 RepID=A0A6J4TQE6_9ACTN|nr:MAG: hypothetical protein AVDCRST_MAG85-3428 [uncultured Solirubrobacteraceae bacterium]
MVPVPKLKVPDVAMVSKKIPAVPAEDETESKPPLRVPPLPK